MGKIKLSFTHLGVSFKDIEFYQYNDSKVVSATGRGLSKAVKTYCKSLKMGKIKTRYSSFAGGDSLRVEIENFDSSITDILQSIFEYGSFDFYTDMQTYKEYHFDSITIEGGYVLSVGVKYLGVEAL